MCTFQGYVSYSSVGIEGSSCVTKTRVCVFVCVTCAHAFVSVSVKEMNNNKRKR